MSGGVYCGPGGYHDVVMGPAATQEPHPRRHMAIIAPRQGAGAAFSVWFQFQFNTRFREFNLELIKVAPEAVVSAQGYIGDHQTRRWENINYLYVRQLW